MLTVEPNRVKNRLTPAKAAALAAPRRSSAAGRRRRHRVGRSWGCPTGLTPLLWSSEKPRSGADREPGGSRGDLSADRVRNRVALLRVSPGRRMTTGHPVPLRSPTDDENGRGAAHTALLETRRLHGRKRARSVSSSGSKAARRCPPESGPFYPLGGGGIRMITIRRLSAYKAPPTS